VVDVPAAMLTRDEHRARQAAAPTKSDGLRALARRLWTNRTFRRWIVAWVGAPVLAIVNGAARELAYKDHVGESTADQISVAPLIGLLALYFWILQRRWPLASTRDALSVGAVWVVLSVLFEFGFGHYVEGDSWADLFGNYDVTEGNIWILILVWIAAGPATVSRHLRRAIGSGISFLPKRLTASTVGIPAR
jgi:hypothetical protein